MSDQQLLERINAACKQGIENYRIGESKSVIVGSLEEIEELLAEPVEAPAPVQPTTVVHVPIEQEIATHWFGDDSDQGRCVNAIREYLEVLREQSQAAQPVASLCRCPEGTCLIHRNSSPDNCGFKHPKQPVASPTPDIDVGDLCEKLRKELHIPCRCEPGDAEDEVIFCHECLFMRSNIEAAIREALAASLRDVQETTLTFARFSALNRQRCESPNGFHHQLSSWSTSDWFTAVMGELGEAANVAKKLNRYRDRVPGNKVSKEELRSQLRKELGDVFVYLDLLAQSLGESIADAAVEVFNAKSDEIGCSIKIEALTSLSTESEKEQQ